MSGLINIPAGGWLAQPAAQPYIPLLQSTVPQGLTLDQWANQIGAESGFNPNAVNPSTGAYGLAQILPSTAAQPGYGVQPISLTQSTPAQQLGFASAYESAVGVNQYSGGGYQLADLTTPGASENGETGMPPVTTANNGTGGVPFAFGDVGGTMGANGTIITSDGTTTTPNAANPNNPTMTTAAGATAQALPSWFSGWLRLGGGALAVLLIIVGVLALVFLSRSPQVTRIVKAT